MSYHLFLQLETERNTTCHRGYAIEVTNPIIREFDSHTEEIIENGITHNRARRNSHTHIGKDSGGHTERC